MRFLDNVLTHFITVAPDGMKRARYAAMRERSVGLGVMGFHSFLQAQGIPFESAMAKSWNMKMFRKIRARRRRRVGGAGEGARRRAPTPPSAASWRASATSSRSRRPPRSASSAAAPAPASSRSRRTSTPTRRCRARSRCAIRICEDVLPAQGRRHAGGLAVDHRARRLGRASRHAGRAGEGGVPHRVRDRPALGGRSRRRPRAVHLPEPVDQSLSAGRHR